MEKGGWYKNFLESIREFEEEQRKWASLIDQYMDKVKKAPPDGQVEILVQMTEVFSNRFSSEEKYLRRLNYPDYKNHMKAHREFTKMIISFRKGVEEAGKPLSKTVQEFLKYWRLNHVQERDTEYWPFVRVQLYLHAKKNIPFPGYLPYAGNGDNHMAGDTDR
jgi:hemerythrin